MKHRCHAHGCNRIVPPRLLMCGRHWGLVGFALQREVWRTYVKGQEETKDPTDEYMVAHHRAVADVARKEGQLAAAAEHEQHALSYQRRVVVLTKELAGR